MTEDEARSYVGSLDVPRGTMARLERLTQLIRFSSLQSNLVGPSTLNAIWVRHIADSMQLLPLAPAGAWIDIGAGAGLPGLAVATARMGAPMTLVEPRRLRAEFLNEAAADLKLDNVIVIASKIEQVTARPYSVISARAVAPLERLFAAACHLADDETVWLLPKGATARDELAAAQRSWQGDFRLVPSVTDSAAAIVVARSVERRK